MNPRWRRIAREALILAAFAALTVCMTWPWALHLKNGVADAGDTYLNAWILWWDYHQTFHAPLHLFDGNIFFPYADTLAFSEHNYGIALLFFPLFALGGRPLTAMSVATLLAIASSGYGAFRLGRTLTGSRGAAWIAGIAFAFVPFRFMHLTHVNYMFTPWIPLALEALVLLARKPSRGRAAWFGAAFFLNGLTCIHWFVLTLVPYATTAVIAGLRSPEPRRFFRRAIAAVAGALLLLAPFLVPYARVARRFGFVRSADDARAYSAEWIHWLTPPDNLRMWRNIQVGDPTFPWERCLFPGLLTILLAAAAVFLWRREDAPAPPVAPRGRPPRLLLAALDVTAVAAAVLAALASGTRPFLLSVAGHTFLKASGPERALVALGAALAIRWALAWPEWFTWTRQPNLLESLRRPARPDGLAIGAAWVVLGVLGSLGMNFPFHRILFELFSIFRSIRVPARWAIVADLGLAVLAGAGAMALLSRLRLRPAARAAGFAVIACALLWELRVAPVVPMSGEGEPDDVTRWLKGTPMRGGIVELPADDERENLWVLRAADHGKPLVDAISGFKTPVALAIESFSARTPVPHGFLTYLEAIPASYLVVHDAFLAPERRAPLRDFLSWAVATGRLRFVKRFTDRRTVDLFAVVRTEPAAPGRRRLPWAAKPVLDTDQDDHTLTGSVDAPLEGAAVAGTLAIRGWARVPGQDLSVTLLIDGEARPPLSFARTPRPDVGAVVRSLGDCAGAGYEATFGFEEGDDGPHEIVAVFRSRDGRERHFPPRKFVWRP